MNTGDLAVAVAEQTGFGKSQARNAVNAAIYAIQNEVKRGGRVSIAGFGTFGQTNRKARKGRNPQTGESVRIPSKKVPKFTAGRVFKEVVNGKRKIERPNFLTKPLTKTELIRLCIANGIQVEAGRVTAKPVKRKAAKKLKAKVSKRTKKKKVTVRKAKKKKVVKKMPLKAATRRKKRA